MSMNAENNSSEPHESKVGTAVKALIALGILGAAGVVSYGFVSKPAKTEKVEHVVSNEIPVTVTTVEQGSYPITIEAMGQVSPALETTLKSHISGEILSVSPSFIPGGALKQSEEILRIDPKDYEFEINAQKAALAQALADLELEKGQQQIAKDELALLQKTSDTQISATGLALRKPQLAQAEANVAAARANLDMAELSLKRTSIVAPFNALIRERNVNLGDRLAENGEIATLVNTDEYWVEIDLPMRDMKWLVFDRDAPENNTKAVISLGDGRGMRTGQVKEVMSAVDTQSRLAQVLVAVQDPLLLADDADTKLHPMILDDYVKVSLTTKPLENISRVSVEHLRDANTLWIARENKLKIVQATVTYKDREWAYITDGLNDDDLIITSAITSPIEGMTLSVHADEE